MKELADKEQDAVRKLKDARNRDPRISVREIFGEDYASMNSALNRARKKLGLNNIKDLYSNTVSPKRVHTRKTMITMPVPESTALACVIGNVESITKFIREYTR